MKYEKTITFKGDPEKAFEVAINTLIPHGFAIKKKAPRCIEFLGPDTLGNKGQNPLTGVSNLTAESGLYGLELKAELGGILKTVKFLVIFVVSMALFFLVLFGFLFGKNPDSPNFILLSLLPLAPWPLIIPIMLTVMKTRTKKSLDSLLNNMALLSKSTV